MNAELENNWDRQPEEAGCPAVGYQDVNISVPVTIKPFGEVGNAKVQCMGKPMVSSGIQDESEKSDDICRFTITQRLRVEVPVIFGARAEAGKASVECGCRGREECCCGSEQFPEEAD